MTLGIAMHCSVFNLVRKHLGSIFHISSFSTLQVDVDELLNVPPKVASQPIISASRAEVLQLIEAGSPYFTTISGGVSTREQSAIQGKMFSLCRSLERLILLHYCCPPSSVVVSILVGVGVSGATVVDLE